MTVRAATPADASSIAALSIEVWLTTYLRQGIRPVFADYVLSEFTSAKIGMVLASAHDTVFVSDNGDGIDGFIRITAGSKGPVAGCSDTEITTFYVRPTQHGQGIGTALLRQTALYCQANNVASVWLATNAENAPAISYYLARGFHHAGETAFTLDEAGYLNNVYTCEIARLVLTAGGKSSNL